MNSIPVNVKTAIAAYAQGSPTEEVCGLVLKNGSVLPINNVLPGGDISDLDGATKHNDFEMPADTLPKHIDIIEAVFHSHWRQESPAILSPNDIINSRAVGLPYILYHTDFDQWDLFDPKGIHPYPLSQKKFNEKSLDFYTGWPWYWGRSDCLTILRSYYRGVLGHHIQDFQRTPTEEEFATRLKTETWNDYEENLGDQGVVKVAEGRIPNDFAFKLHDIVLMRLQGRVPHHVGIIVKIEPLQILHHLERGRLSEVVPYGAARIRQTASVWRLAQPLR